MGEKMDEPKTATQDFTKAQILGAKKYADRVDLVTALLDEGSTYTIDAVDKLVSAYMKKEVK